MGILQKDYLTRHIHNDNLAELIREVYVSSKKRVKPLDNFKLFYEEVAASKPVLRLRRGQQRV